MTPAELVPILFDIVHSRFVAHGANTGELSPEKIILERPRNREHGDWAANIALKLAKQLEITPHELATEIAAKLRHVPGIADVKVAGPGFLNITLDTASAGALAAQILAAGENYGHSSRLAGQKINLEFVSANPTGPLHIGGTRWAAVGDSLARLLEASGASVIREYYFNDHGAQIDRFARSLLAAHLGQPAPEDGYGGSYINEIATQVAAECPLDTLPNSQQQEIFRERGVAQMFTEIKQSLHRFGVDFDVYFHEDSLHTSGAVERAITRLRENGHIYQKDGATWLGTSAFGDDKDRVVIKSDGEAAYISGDLAYYLDKRERGFDRCILLLGADHHGYVVRLMAACQAFGDTPGVNLEVLIGQMVNLIRGGEPVRMSKRAGTVVTMEDLTESVGVDAARYALVRSSIDSSIDIDLDLLAKRTNDNPVFYVQYAHARTRAVSRNAHTAGVAADNFDPSLLKHESESVLLAALADFPRVVAQASDFREPHRVARYLEELSGNYHRWYGACRVIPMGTEPLQPVHQARLVLNEATGQVLRNGLRLLGVSAPERM